VKVLVNLNGERSTWLQRSRMLALAIRPILEALVVIDQLYLRTHRCPPLYRSGVRYREEPPNHAKLGHEASAAKVEDFSAIPAILERGWGDCDDLSPWRVAELREAGEPARIRIQWKRHPETGQKFYHVLVRRADGSIEDPSLKLGMRS
jgi:hypothetical protein